MNRFKRIEAAKASYLDEVSAIALGDSASPMVDEQQTKQCAGAFDEAILVDQVVVTFEVLLEALGQPAYALDARRARSTDLRI